MKGSFAVLDDYDDANVQEGLALLASKSAMVKALADSGSLSGCVILCLQCKELAFSTYEQALRKQPDTVVRF